jgi:hypothetical protein
MFLAHVPEITAEVTCSIIRNSGMCSCTKGVVIFANLSLWQETVKTAFHDYIWTSEILSLPDCIIDNVVQ